MALLVSSTTSNCSTSPMPCSTPSSWSIPTGIRFAPFPSKGRVVQQGNAWQWRWLEQAA